MGDPDLDDVIANATVVRVTRVGELGARDRGASEPRALTSDPDAILRLREAPFFEGHELLATVTYLPKNFVRWRGGVVPEFEGSVRG